MRLPGGHWINTVMEPRWVRIELSYLTTQNKEEVKNVDIMREFPIEGLHYYCETFDITRPYPSPYPVHSYVPALFF